MHSYLNSCALCRAFFSLHSQLPHFSPRMPRFTAMHESRWFRRRLAGKTKQLIGRSASEPLLEEGLGQRGSEARRASQVRRGQVEFSAALGSRLSLAPCSGPYRATYFNMETRVEEVPAANRRLDSEASIYKQNSCGVLSGQMFVLRAHLREHTGTDCHRRLDTDAQHKE